MAPDLKGLVTRVALVGILGVSTAAAGTVLWRHYSALVDSKADLTAKVAKLEASLAGETARADALKESIDKWDKAAAVQAEALVTLAQVQLQAGAYSRELKSVLSKHDLRALAGAKPALVESRINAGTARAFGLLERSSGATASSSTTGDAPIARPAPPAAGKP